MTTMPMNCTFSDSVSSECSKDIWKEPQPQSIDYQWHQQEELINQDGQHTPHKPMKSKQPASPTLTPNETPTMPDSKASYENKTESKVSSWTMNDHNAKTKQDPTRNEGPQSL